MNYMYDYDSFTDSFYIAHTVGEAAPEESHDTGQKLS